MRSGVVTLYACTLFVAGALLFLVQPMFARMVLPLLGGSPAVWNTAMVFYQVALLVSYLYAHASQRWLTRAQQVALHLVLLLLPLVVLPIAVPHGWSPPTESNPIPWMLGLMLVAIGLPFCVVATTSPLMQMWFSQLDDPAAQRPYALYVSSNAGSMLSLLSYPLLLERTLSLAEQSRLWTYGYALFALLSGGCAITFRRTINASVPASGRSAGAEVTAEHHAWQPLDFGRRLRWLLLAFVPSSLMLSVTMYLSTNIAPIPLLWVAVLAIYLLTFILAFATTAIIPRQLVRRAMPVGVLLLLLTMLAPIRLPIYLLMALHVLVFFVIALACHGALADDTPPASQLTEFYLWLSIGGALGGIFNAIVAPMIFSSVLEYPLVLVLASLLIRATGPLLRSDKREPVHSNWLRADRFEPMDVALPLLLAALTYVAIVSAERMRITSPNSRAAITAAIPALLCYGLAGRQLRFAFGIAALVAVNALANRNPREMLAVRSFFGITRVMASADGDYTQMVHGSTLHGMQARDPGRRRETVSYYFRNGPIGQLITSRESAGVLHRVAVVGLGTGTLACYRLPGEAWTFYEIDPAIKRIALDSRWFTFVRDCAPDATIVLGDARLSLNAAPAGTYDLIILDAYSSDAIPVHLLTREALALYRARLAAGGAIAFHISNLYFDLAPVVAALAHDAGMASRRMHDSPIALKDDSRGKWTSEWVAVARDSADFGVLTRDPRWVADSSPLSTPVWTDDFSSTLSALKIK